MKVEGKVAVVKYPDGETDYAFFSDWFAILFFSHGIYYYDSEAKHFAHWCESLGITYRIDYVTIEIEAI